VRRQTLSERFERSSLGQLVITAGVVLFLLCEIGTNLPSSAIQRSESETTNRFVRVLGVEQEWGVFAPDPRPISLQLEARITFEDGSHATWHLPHGSDLGGNLRFYRWRKWLERARSDSYSDIWAPTARWIASQYADRPSPVRQVQLVRRFHDNVLDEDQPPYQSFVYCTLHLEPGSRPRTEGCAP
jgi:hypothetical protein